MSSLAGVIPTEELLARLAKIVGDGSVLHGDAITEDLTHDEGLVSVPRAPLAVVMPGSTDDVAAIVAVALEVSVPITARGSATGLSGGCVPTSGGIVVAFDRMNSVLEIDESDHVAVGPEDCVQLPLLLQVKP